MSTGRCSACGQPIRWMITAAGHRQPVNPTPDAAGNLAAYRDAAGTWRCRVPTDEQPRTGYEHTYMPHAATCQHTHHARRAAPAVLPPGVLSLAAYRRTRRA
jgi:hypothetical protein